MLEFLNSPFFYIILAVVLVFLYVVIANIYKSKKGAKKDSKKQEEKNDGAAEIKKEEVVSYSDFKNEEKVDNFNGQEPLINEFEAQSFEEQAKQFFGDEGNQEFIEDFFGASTFDMFSEEPVKPVDYTIQEFNYNKVWETEPDAISFDYNYDVNYEPPKKQSRIRKNFYKMNKIQKAIVFSNLFGSAKKFRGE